MTNIAEFPSKERRSPTPVDPDWYKPAERPIAEIIADLSKPIPKQYLETRKQGGRQITYLPWFPLQL